jgi:uncharacterized phosphosugar-binding protein
MNVAERFYKKTQEILGRVVETQMPLLNRAATLVADTIQRDGIIYALASGHSSTVAAELYFRAGGLANFDVIHDKTFGRAERLPGYAKALLEGYPISSNDLLIIISNSGRNALPVEMALEAKRRGITTIGITSLAYSQAVTSRLASGSRLFEICDVVIDNCGVLGDAALGIGPDESLRMCPTSTLAGVFIANCIAAMAAEKLLERKAAVPVFVSANLDGGDEHNQKLLDFMRKRVRGL